MDRRKYMCLIIYVYILSIALQENVIIHSLQDSATSRRKC